MNIRFIHCILGLSIFFYHAIFAQTSWDVLFYIDSSDNLSHAVIKNITDALHAFQERCAQGADNIRVSIQLHSLHGSDIAREAYRYQLGAQGMKFCERIMLPYNPVGDFVDAVRWSMQQSDAEHHMIIMGGHGFGVLDPVWSDDEDDWVAEDDATMHLLKSKKKHRYNSAHKALLLQADPQLYMTLGQLRQALGIITSDILGGKALDILGMDMCSMGMFEVAYEIEPYVRYFVSSQEYEEDYGWDYYTIIKNLGAADQEPADVACRCVESFDAFYSTKRPDEFYTLSAVDLSYVGAIKDTIDRVAALLKMCNFYYGLDFVQDIRNARAHKLPSLCLMPMYTDLYSTYHVLQHILAQYPQSHMQEACHNALFEGMKLIKKSIIAHVQGSQREHTHGISCYFPLTHIDSSYGDCTFAQDSLWPLFLQEIIA